MKESEVRKVKKVLEFERSGETLSVEIEMKNPGGRKSGIPKAIYGETRSN